MSRKKKCDKCQASCPVHSQYKMGIMLHVKGEHLKKSGACPYLYSFIADNNKDYEFNKNMLLKFLNDHHAQYLPYINHLRIYNNVTGAFIQKIVLDNPISTLSRKLTANI